MLPVATNTRKITRKLNTHQHRCERQQAITTTTITPAFESMQIAQRLNQREKNVVYALCDLSKFKCHTTKTEKAKMSSLFNRF